MVNVDQKEALYCYIPKTKTYGEHIEIVNEVHMINT